MPRTTQVIQLSDIGFRVEDAKDGSVVFDVLWDAIDRIEAWKADLVSVDRICMGFGSNESDALKTVHEEMEGWNELQDELEIRFGVTHSDWWRRVALPPFHENHTVLWTK